MISNAAADDDGQESPLRFFRLVITQQPANAAGVIGGQAVFTCAFITNVPASFTTYQWQIQTDGVTWGNLLETTGYYEGVTTTTLTVKAIDNFLASRTSRNFRCVATNYAGPLATNSAALTIAIFANWTPDFYKLSTAAVSAVCSMTLPGSIIPTMTGTAGPFTYFWFRNGGNPFTCVDNTLQSPTWTYDALGASGLFNSQWRCRITFGAQTITTETYYLFAYFAAAPIAAAIVPTPRATVAGAAFTVVPSFVGPWADTLGGARKYRQTDFPDIMIANLQIALTTFVQSGSPLNPGAATQLFVFYPAATPDNSGGLGSAVFYG